jgi:glyceraldehyde 3-phosphate dehydrogenase
MAVRVAINGFGRTGRAFLRAALKRTLDVQVVALNDLAPPEAMARLLVHDSVHGLFPEPVFVEGDTLMVGPMAVRVTAEASPQQLPWRDLGIDVVIESTGRFTNREQAAAHLDAGAARVIVSAPARGVDATFVLGVNEDSFDPARHLVVSNASCTTNCLALLAQVLDDAFGIEDGFMTTVHAYTGDQQLVDALHKDPRRGRSAALNIVPTTTGAARATGLVLPRLDGRLDGLSLRVPVADGSITDLVATVRATPTAQAICDAYREAAGSARLRGLLEFSDEDLVSTDIVGSRASCVFDSKLTMAHRHLVKVFGWYDNEMGYSSRLVDLAAVIGRTG